MYQEGESLIRNTRVNLGNRTTNHTLEVILFIEIEQVFMCNVTCIINKIYHEMWHLVFIILYEQTGYEVEIELKTPSA